MSSQRQNTTMQPSILGDKPMVPDREQPLLLIVHNQIRKLRQQLSRPLSNLIVLGHQPRLKGIHDKRQNSIGMSLQ